MELALGVGGGEVGREKIGRVALTSSTANRQGPLPHPGEGRNPDVLLAVERQAVVLREGRERE